MTQKRAHPLMSEGARLERKALRAYLRRLRAAVIVYPTEGERAIERVLAWVLRRQKRYDVRPGGLGR